MNDIVMKSNENICVDTGKVWERKCPECGTSKTYSNKYNWIYANLNNSKCRHCNGLGRKHSNETKEKIRLGNVGKVVSDETRAKIRIKRCGMKHSTISKMKVSASLIGNKRRVGKIHSDETRRKFSETRRGTHTGINNSMYGKVSPKKGVPMSPKVKAKLRAAHLGKKLSLETRRKMREIHLLKKMANGGYYAAKHNPIACEYFDWLNKWNGWSGRYATNGGEMLVGNYFLDYYEPTCNIVIEWDEPSHYYVDGKLKPKDIFRMDFIKSKLKCDFYRYRQDTGELRKY